MFGDRILPRDAPPTTKPNMGGGKSTINIGLHIPMENEMPKLYKITLAIAEDSDASAAKAPKNNSQRVHNICLNVSLIFRSRLPKHVSPHLCAINIGLHRRITLILPLVKYS